MALELATGDWRLATGSAFRDLQLHLLAFVGIEAVPTSRLVGALGAEHDQLVGLDDALGEHACPATSVAHREALGVVFGVGNEGRERLEWAAEEIQVEPGHDDLLAGLGKPGDHLDQPIVEELRLLDTHHHTLLLYP